MSFFYVNNKIGLMKLYSTCIFTFTTLCLLINVELLIAFTFLIMCYKTGNIIGTFLFNNKDKHNYLESLVTYSFGLLNLSFYNYLIYKENNSYSYLLYFISLLFLSIILLFILNNFFKNKFDF